MASNIFIDFISNPWVLISLIFWGIILALALLLRKKKDAIYVFFPLIALMKTKKLNKLINRIGQKAPRFWKGFWTVGIFVSFGLMIFALYFFFINMLNLIFFPQPENIVAPLIPGVTVDLPLFAWLILPILFIMTTHEFAHGIAASAEDVEVKSTGVLGAGFFFLIGFGAFVEVDERELYSSKYGRNTRLRISAAGTYINGLTFVFTSLILIIFPLLISPFYGKEVTEIVDVYTEEEGGFNYGNINNGDVIEALKKTGTSDFIYIDGDQNITLHNLLYNRTSEIVCTVGDTLTLRIYIPSTNEFTEKGVTLGPRYLHGIAYKNISNTQLEITKVYSEAEGGNNYNKGLTEGMIITAINGTSINYDAGNTFEKYLTNYNLTAIELTTMSGIFVLDLDIIGVLIGFSSNSYYRIPINSIGQFFTGNFPIFLFRELLWLFLLSLSIAIFNMLPLPVFDGDRMVKEVIEWRIGEEYKEKKKKTDKFLFDENEKYYGLSEYRVEKIDSIKMTLRDKIGRKYVEKSEILIGEDNFELIDKIGDNYKSTVSLNFSKQNKELKDSIIKINYEYWYDSKRPQKKKILNIIRYTTLAILVGNISLSFIMFGVDIFAFLN